MIGKYPKKIGLLVKVNRSLVTGRWLNNDLTDWQLKRDDVYRNGSISGSYHRGRLIIYQLMLD